MSKTDKDIPWRIREFFEGEIEHDHRHGECVIETLDEAKRGFVGRHNHYARCKKRSRVEIACPGAGYTRDDCSTAMTEWLALDIYARLELRIWDAKRYTCTTRKTPHWKYVYDETIYCPGCEDIEARRNPTCDYSIPYGRSRYFRSPPPSWYINHVWTGPERVRERDKLNDLRREYNAHGELEDGDFENRQTRHSARWLWW